MYQLFIFRRAVASAVFKFTTFCAKHIKCTATMNIMECCYKKYSRLLVKEAKFCMQKVVKWQKRAKKCVQDHENLKK